MEKLSNVLYLSTTSLSKSVSEVELRPALAKIGGFLGVHAVLERSTKAKKSITLTYTLYNSTSRYVFLTLPAFAGLMSREYVQEGIDMRRRSSGAYVVQLDFRRR
jgi:hypothetical protein